jgi:cytochrome P450
MISGYETAVGTLSYALYQLALNSEIQQILRAEILKMLGRNDG